MECAGFSQEIYGMYSVGSLTGTEASGIVEHLSLNCSRCQAELRQAGLLWAAVGAITRPVNPRRALRRRVLQSVGTSPSWWEQPVFVIAGFAMLAAGVAVGLAVLRQPPSPGPIAFSPRYQVVLPSPSTAQPLPLPPITAPDTSQAAALTGLNEELSRERQAHEQARRDLEQQRSLLATAQQASLDLEKRYTALLQQNANSSRAALDDTQRRLAALTARTQELERQVATYRVLLETQRRRLDQDLQLASLMSDPQLRVVKLRPTEKGRTSEGHALIAGAARMVFFANDLPALPAGRVYQLWLVRSHGQGIASAGLFSPDTSSRGTLELRDPNVLSGVTALAVTDEPAGGSLQPTGHKWMIGS